MDIPTVTTARLLLRPFRTEDAEPLFHILGEEGVLRYFPSPDPPPLDRVERFVIRQLQHWEEHGFGWWAVEPRDEARLIGWNGLQYLPETDEVEVAFLLSRPYWGRGLAAEGARAGLHFGFAQLGIEQIVAIVHRENRASQRVIEKLGMTMAGPAIYFGIEVYRYVIEASEFRDSNFAPPTCETS